MTLAATAPDWLTLDAVLVAIITFMGGAMAATIWSHLGSRDIALGIGIGSVGIGSGLANLMAIDVLGVAYPFMEAFIRTLQAVTVLYIPEVFPLDALGALASVAIVAYVSFRMLQAYQAAGEGAEELKNRT